jgi:hypothetical protein
MDGVRGTPPSEREAQFLWLRNTIEKIASETFEVEGAVHAGIVRIFQKHLSIGRAGKVVQWSTSPDADRPLFNRACATDKW